MVRQQSCVVGENDNHSIRGRWHTCSVEKIQEGLKDDSLLLLIVNGSRYKF
jgi:hypothetical protein